MPQDIIKTTNIEANASEPIPAPPPILNQDMMSIKQIQEVVTKQLQPSCNEMPIMTGIKPLIMPILVRQVTESIWQRIEH